MGIIRTKVFGNNESFVEWQEENIDNITIINVIPLVQNIKGATVTNQFHGEEKINMKVSCSIFITYILKD